MAVTAAIWGFPLPVPTDAALQKPPTDPPQNVNQLPLYKVVHSITALQTLRVGSECCLEVELFVIG